MKQDELLNSFFKNRRPYTKLYSYHHIVNGFAVELTAEEVSIVCLNYTLFHSFSAPSFFFLFLHTFSSGVGKGFHSNNKTENMVLSNSFCGFLGQANPLTFCVCV
jgi:hypothetical protein